MIKTTLSRAAFAAAISLGIFSSLYLPSIIVTGVTYLYVAVFSIYGILAGLTVLHINKKTFIYGAAVAKNRLGSNMTVKSLVDGIIPITMSVSWIVASNLVLGGAIGAVWIANRVIANRGESLFYKLDKDEQKKFMKIVQKKYSS